MVDELYWVSVGFK